MNKLNLKQPATKGEIDTHLATGGLVVTQDSDGKLKFFAAVLPADVKKVSDLVAFQNAVGITRVYLAPLESIPDFTLKPR